MKRQIIISISIMFLFSGLVFAKTYKAKTKDNEVEKIENVVIEEADSVVTVSTSSFTLEKIDQHIANLQERILALQQSIQEWQARRVEVLKQAKKIKLKAPKPKVVTQ